MRVSEVLKVQFPLAGFVPGDRVALRTPALYIAEERLGTTKTKFLRFKHMRKLILFLLAFAILSNFSCKKDDLIVPFNHFWVQFPALWGAHLALCGGF
jgi:hypothetical protein